MVIAVDIDEVLADLLVDFLNFYNRKNGLDIKPEDFSSYDYAQELGKSTAEMIELWKEYIKLGGFRNTPVIPDALAYIPELAKTNELIAITGRAEITRDDTQYWLDRNFPGVFKKLFHLTADHYLPPTISKFQICHDNQADIIIDDMPEYGDDCARNGIKFILFDKPWNHKKIDLPNVTRVHSWPEVVAEVKKIAKI